MAKMIVRRKAHSRRNYVTRRGRRRGGPVRGSTFAVPDRGKRGRGLKVVTISKPGSLGGESFFSKSAEERRVLESKVAKKKGERVVQGKLQAISIFNKGVNPDVAGKARADRRWVAENFIGKRKVPSPQGLT